MKVVIRPAVKEDCPEMLKLVRELAVYERAPEAATVTLEHFADCGFGEQPVWWAYVACLQTDTTTSNLNVSLEVTPAPGYINGIVGFALYYIRYSTWKGKKMYLEDIIVTEPWRGKGIGSALMNRLIRDAKEKGYQGMTWQVLDWNEPALNFYKRYGPDFDAEWVNVMLDFRD